MKTLTSTPAFARLAAVAATAAAAVALSACGSSSSPNTGSAGSSSSTSTGMPGGMSMSSTPDSTPASSADAAAGAPATGPHNSADVAFATDMIPHHAQALEMATMASKKATDPQVKRLAQAIEGAQTPEIVTMSGWLTGWGKPVPDTSMGGMDMGGMHMPGAMSSADMSQLDAATGPAFDKLWLTQMIGHHRGAVTMARTELRTGQNSDAETLARKIIIGQSKEIATMTELLPTIG